jgi:hypothetical protein
MRQSCNYLSKRINALKGGRFVEGFNFLRLCIFFWRVVDGLLFVVDLVVLLVADEHE